MKTRKLLISILTGLCVCLTSATLLTACKDEHTHSYTQQTTTEATCTEKGVITYTCSCNDTYTEEIPALGHDEETHQAQAPTCTEIGWEEYVTCQREGCEYSTYVEIPALNHDKVQHNAQAATCTEIGWDAYETCSRCDYTTYVEIPALTHDKVQHQAQAATCTEKGWNAYETCTRCNYTTYEEIPALTHDKVQHNAQAATCTEKGWNAYETCSRCDYTTYEEIPALTHDKVEHQAQAATCTEKGWNAYETCSRCNYTTYVELPALTHDKVQHNAQAATCTEKGWEAYETCTRCSYTTYAEIPATGIHTWDNGTETKTPTCTKEGEMTYLCTVCKKITKTEAIATTPHEYANEWSSDETYHYHECKCGQRDKEIKHSPSAPATATTKQVCTVCDYIIQEETGILFNTLSVDGIKLYGKVSNETIEFSFIEEVIIKGNASYVVDNDKDCGSPIASKTVDLVVGDNVFYVLETIGNNVKLYTVTIRRRPMYEVTFDTNGGTAVEKQTVEEDSLAVEPEVSKQGYTLAGWNYDFSLPITKNTHITAIWDANNGTKYTVNYYLQNIGEDKYTLHATEELKGVTNTTVTAVVKNYEHFTYNEEKSTIEGIIYPDGSLVLSVYYTRNNYTIQAGYEIVDRDTAITQTETIPYGVECTCEATSIDGYTFLGWYDEFGLVSENLSFAFIAEKNVTYIQRWKANDNTRYTVVYYLQNIDNDDYMIYKTEELAGSTDTTATADVKAFSHFTYNASKSVISGNIDGNGKLVLSVYYTRDSYKIIANNNNENAGESTKVHGNYRYDKQITLTANTNAGYTFLGWFDGETLACATANFTFNVEKNITYTAKWSANTDTKYTVNYYLQNLNDNDYTLYETKVLEGETDTTANAEINTYNHFTYNESESMISGNIDGNGDLVLNVYYTRDSYTIATAVNNAKAGTVTNGNTYRFDKQITLTATTNAGYTFLGWYEGENLVCETADLTFNVEGNATYIAHWQANDDTMYVVNYYLQTLEGGYTLYQATPLAGVTDTTANAKIKEYNHFTYNEGESTISGNIAGNGSLVLHVYYTRNQYDVATNTNNTKGGTYTQLSTTYYYDFELILTATTKAGYTFLGWFDGETLACATANFKFNVDKNVTYTAKWSANTDTKYTVNYYLQNLNDNNYTLYESKELKGETNTTATADVKTFPHFTYNASKSVISGNINGNGNCQLYVYYTRDSYTIATQTNNEKAGTISGAGTYKYDKEITLTATTKAGYTFLGWYEGETRISETTSLTFKAEKDVTYTAKWRVHTDTPYTVEYYFAKIEGGYTVETFELTGETDTTATAEIKEYSHFTYRASGSTTSGNIAGNGSLVLRVYYTRNQYDVATDTNNTKGGNYEEIYATYYYDFELTLTATTNVGYTWLGWYEGNNLVCATTEFTFKVEKDVTYTAKWQANTNTKYKVNYYLQNVDSDTYTLQESVDLTGTTDILATAEIKTYTHFVYNASKSTTSGNINGNGDQILKVYYTRVNYTVTTSRNNTKGGTVSGGGSYNYDKQITLTASTNAGYIFLGWFEGETPVCTTASFTLNVQKNVTYTAKWQANNNTKYTVNYHLQNVDNNNYTLYETVECTGTTDTIATATIKDYTHFTYKASSSTISGTIKGDGSLVLNVYYTRNSYTVTTEGNNEKAGSVTRGGTYRYDKQITLTATTNAGYTFLGWFEGDVCVCATEIFAFGIDKTVTYTAKWQANEDTVYTVNYYLQNIDNDNYTVYETEELSSTTDTTVYAEIKTYNHFTYKANASTISGNLAGNVSLVLNVYYTRDSYTISASVNNTKAGTVTGDGSYRYNKEITLTATTNAGYTFLGWYEGETYICDTADFTFNVEGNATYTAHWQANDDTMYVVNYYLQTLEGGYTLHQATPLTDVTDTTATAEIKEYQHFTYNASESTISGNVNGDESLVLSVYYTRDSYTIIAEQNLALAGTVSGDGTYLYDSQITLTATTNAGYTFLGWYHGESLITEDSQMSLIVSGDTTYTAKWSANTDTKYIVNYYWQNIDDDNYTLFETVQLAGTTDTETTAEIKEYGHFTFNENESETIGNINGDESLILSVYYTRDSYTVSAKKNLSLSSGGTISGGGTYRYGKEITLTASLYLGYIWLGLYNDEILMTEDVQYTLIVENDVTFTGYFEVKAEMSNFYFSTTPTTCSITGIKDKTVRTIIVPDYVTSISEGVFNGCSSLERITLPFVGESRNATGYQSIFGYIFAGAAYDNCLFVQQVYNWRGAYWNSSYFQGDAWIPIPKTLIQVTITGGYISEAAFAVDTTQNGEVPTNIEKIILEEGVISIGAFAFKGCKNLKSINIPTSVTSIGVYAFHGTSLTSVTFADTTSWTWVVRDAQGGISRSGTYYPSSATANAEALMKEAARSWSKN